mgnify:CR=1 FL=1
MYTYVTDDYFGFLDDSEGANLSGDKLDIGIGRFPVRTLEEAKIAVNKSIAYIENKTAGAWKNNISFVADDGDNNLHMSQANLLADPRLTGEERIRSHGHIEVVVPDRDQILQLL